MWTGASDVQQSGDLIGRRRMPAERAAEAQAGSVSLLVLHPGEVKSSVMRTVSLCTKMGVKRLLLRTVTDTVCSTVLAR